jgi:uncharacterized protein YbbK (DUF523 family)
MSSNPDPGVEANTWPNDLQPGEPVLVSACLLGERTRYDGAHKRDADLLIWLQKKQVKVIPVCPEVLGGLTVPRPAAELKSGDGKSALMDNATVRIIETGDDVSVAFLTGARIVVQKAMECGVRYAFLQERSPSCGVNSTYIDGKLTQGLGVTSAALELSGIRLVSVQ